MRVSLRGTAGIWTQDLLFTRQMLWPAKPQRLLSEVFSPLCPYSYSYMCETDPETNSHRCDSAPGGGFLWV